MNQQCPKCLGHWFWKERDYYGLHITCGNCGFSMDRLTVPTDILLSEETTNSGEERKRRRDPSMSRTPSGSIPS